MLRNGKYSVWFKIPLGEGTGSLELGDGKVTGGDTVISYSGSYTEDGDLFTATISTWRHAPGQPSLFGIDNVDLTITGQSKAKWIACSGTANQAPGLTIEASLVRVPD
jgi:hypothetical protein